MGWIPKRCLGVQLKLSPVLCAATEFNAVSDVFETDPSGTSAPRGEMPPAPLQGG